MATDHVAELHEARELLCEDSEGCIIGNNKKSEEDAIDSEVDDGDDLMISDGGNASTTSDANVVTEYLPLEKVKSVVWTHFGFPARSGKFIQKDKHLRKKVFCKLCKQSFSYKGSTTNMIVHLQSHHSAEFDEIADEFKSGRGAQSSTVLPKGLHDSFKELTPLSRSSSRWKTLIYSVCYFLANDLHPLSTVNDPGFLHMLKTFELRYTPPRQSDIQSTLYASNV